MKHTAQIENGGWVIKDGSGNIITETKIHLGANISDILTRLDNGENICNILFHGIFES